MITQKVARRCNGQNSPGPCSGPARTYKYYAFPSQVLEHRNVIQYSILPFYKHLKMKQFLTRYLPFPFWPFSRRIQTSDSSSQSVLSQPIQSYIPTEAANGFLKTTSTIDMRLRERKFARLLRRLFSSLTQLTSP